MFDSSIKRIRRIIPKPQGSTCGLPSNWMVYGIGIASVIEALTFMAIFAIVIDQVEKEKIITDKDTWWITNVHIDKITSCSAVTVYVIQLVSAGILTIGQYLRIAAFLATYFLLALLGIVLNLLVGVEAIEHERTRVPGLAMMCLTIFHLILAVIVLKVCKEIRDEQLAIGGQSNPNTIHIPPPATPPTPAVTPEQRLPQRTSVLHNVPSSSYPHVYINPYIPPGNDYDFNSEPNCYRPHPIIPNEYSLQSPNRPIKPYEEDDDTPTIYYAPHQAPPRYSEIDIGNTERSGQQTKHKKEEYFGFSIA